MRDSPYLKVGRLGDVLAALQFLARYKDYDLTDEELREKIAASPTSAASWAEVLTEHPEFFRQSEHGKDFSLVLRRTNSKVDGIRPPLEPAELSLLVETATFLQRHAVDHQALVERTDMERRALRRGWLQMAVSLCAAIIAAAAAIVAAVIRAGGL